VVIAALNETAAAVASAKALIIGNFDFCLLDIWFPPVFLRLKNL
jgi:hypothetical protein